MKKALKIALISTAVLLVVMLIGLLVLNKTIIKYQTLLSKENELSIVAKPAVVNFNRGRLDTLPEYNPDSGKPFQVDLRGYDLATVDLRSKREDLLYADFDEKTKWPEQLPDGFNPEEIMEIGKNPGLMLRELHKEGITGKGVGIAIIDQALLVDHIEYKEQLKLYEEIHLLNNNGDVPVAQMHGPAVASIAVGKTVGVAPEADLYYIAETHGTFFIPTGFKYDFSWLAKSVNRILDINQTLPAAKKIRVISISVGWSPQQKGYNDMIAAVKRAKEEGVFIVSSSLGESYGLYFNGLGRHSLDDPDLTSSYHEGLFWSKKPFFQSENTLLIPMDSRCVASPTGESDYVFYRSGGWSWSIPYIAGLYVLACQVKPDVTPGEFWKVAISTGDEFMIQGKKYGYVVNPVRLIEGLRE